VHQRRAHNGILIVALIRCSTADARIPHEELIALLADGISRHAAF
jgi:hypothetical protein